MYLLAQDDPEFSTFIVFAVILFIGFVFLVLLTAIFVFGRHWLKAFLGGTPISIFQVIGMIFRRSDISTVIQQGVAANQAGHPISWSDLERAAIEGVDLEAVVKTYCICRENGEHYSMKELITAARESKLAKLTGV